MKPVNFYNQYVNELLTLNCEHDEIPGEVLAALGFKRDLAYSYSVSELDEELKIEVEIAPGINVNVNVWLKDIDALLNN